MTIPGFTPSHAQVQDHIHLGLVPRDGSNPIGFSIYGEPPYKFGHINKRQPIFRTQSSFTESWDGTPHDHTLLNGGLPVVKQDYQYTLRCSSDDIEILAKMTTGRVYLVDNRHCPDNESHTPFVKIMFLESLGFDDNLDPALQFNNVTLTFRDMNTVPGL